MSLCASCYSIVGRASLFPLIQLVLISWLLLNVEAYAFSHCMEMSRSATAWYDATSFDVDANMWLDKTDNGAHANVTGTMSSAVLFANEQPAVVGDENATVTFPTYVNGQHTVINLCKYNGDTNSSKGRIVQSSIATAWFGHYGGQSGVAFEGEWLTPQRDMFGDEWVLSVQQSGRYRANGFDLTLVLDIARTVPMGRLQINDGFMNDEGSDFACAEVILFNDQILSRDEMGCVEDYLNEKYALGLARYVKPSIPFASCLVDGHSVSAWYDAGSYLPAFGVWNDQSLKNWNGNAFSDPYGALRYFDGADVSNALYRNHQPVVYGNWSTYVDFPLSIGDEYTVVSLSKYNGARKRLILQSLWACVWPPAVFGHYVGANGVAHNGASWITTTSDKFGSNWVLGVQTAATYRGNGLNLTARVVSTPPAIGQLAINRGQCAMHLGPASDFAFAELVVFNGQTLNEDEQICIERFFQIKYSLGLAAQPTTPWPTNNPSEDPPTNNPSEDPTVSPSAMATTTTTTTYVFIIQFAGLNSTQIEDLVLEVVETYVSVPYEFDYEETPTSANQDEDESLSVRLSVSSDVVLDYDVIQSTIRSRAVEEYGDDVQVVVEVEVETPEGQVDTDDRNLPMSMDTHHVMYVLLIVGCALVILCVVSFLVCCLYRQLKKSLQTQNDAQRMQQSIDEKTTNHNDKTMGPGAVHGATSVGTPWSGPVAMPPVPSDWQAGEQIELPNETHRPR